jgi:phosphoesterase RecJ-like protein
MMQSLSEIGDIVNRAHRVLLIAHAVPDGDTLGSALGLAWALRKRDIEARLSCADAVPRQLRFLPGWQDFAARPRTDEDAILVIDASDLERIGSLYDAAAFAAVPVVNIDHHVTNLHFGSTNLVQPKAATAELVLEVIRYLRIPLDATIATCLLTGLVTDTLCFRTNSTTADSLRVAALLVEAGAPLAQIADLAFNHRSLPMLRLWGRALANIQNADGVFWTEISQSLLRQVGADQEASRGLANFLGTVDEAPVSAVFRELEGGQVEVSFRSSAGIDISAVALSFGGGGHAQAAGCLLTGGLSEVRERVLAALRQAIVAQRGQA